MAKIVLGVGTSHGPLLSTPPEMWHLRAADDRKMIHPFRGGDYAFDELVKMRAAENLPAKVTIEERTRRFNACQTAIATLAGVFKEAKPDVAVIVGNDQMEIFTDQNIPAFMVYYGETIDNVPFSDEQRKRMPPGILIAEKGHHPERPESYPGLPALGQHLIRTLIAHEFDVAAAKRLPHTDASHTSGIPHAYGFVYRQIMNGTPVPSVPVFVNTFYPPNQPKPHRCLEMGKILKNWIPVAGIMMNRGMKMNLVDYVPCYRSEAGTGNAMAFVYWQ
jgi:hypothetical protein